MTVKKADSKSLLEQENMVHAMAYFPYGIGAIAMFFLGSSDKKKALKHIKYSWVLAAIVFLLMLLLKGIFGPLLMLVYLGFSAFLAYKAYNWEDIQIDMIDSLEGKVQEKIKK